MENNLLVVECSSNSNGHILTNGIVEEIRDSLYFAYSDFLRFGLWRHFSLYICTYLYLPSAFCFTLDMVSAPYTADSLPKTRSLLKHNLRHPQINFIKLRELPMLKLEYLSTFHLFINYPIRGHCG